MAKAAPPPGRAAMHRRDPRGVPLESATIRRAALAFSAVEAPVPGPPPPSECSRTGRAVKAIKPPPHGSAAWEPIGEVSRHAAFCGGCQKQKEEIEHAHRPACRRRRHARRSAPTRGLGPTLRTPMFSDTPSVPRAGHLRQRFDVRGDRHAVDRRFHALIGHLDPLDVVHMAIGRDGFDTVERPVRTDRLDVEDVS